LRDRKNRGGTEKGVVIYREGDIWRGKGQNKHTHIYLERESKRGENRVVRIFTKRKI
jgi:hypothetical protein